MKKIQFNSPQWLPALVLLLIAGSFLLGIGSVPLTDLDEGAFAEASREMLARGDWVSPWLLDAPRFDKPALIHWLQMASFSVFGINAWAVRLPSAIAGLVWVGAIGIWAKWLTRRFFPELDPGRVGLWSLAVAGSSIGILAISRSSTADATLNAFLVLSLLAMWRAFDCENNDLVKSQVKNQARMWARISSVFIGLGLLTKGPVALLIPAVAALFGALGHGRIGWQRLGVLLADGWSWTIVVALTAPWYWLQYQAQGAAFIDGFFGTHNLGRFTSTMHGFSSDPSYYPLWTLIALLPWAPLAVWAIFDVLRSGLWKEKGLWMCWGVFLFVIVFFSFSATKLPHYGFYGLSGLLVIMGLVLEKRLARSIDDRFIALTIQRLFTSALLVLLAAASLWWGHIPELVGDVYYREVLQNAGGLIGDGWVWFALALITSVAISFWRSVWAAMLGGAVFSMVLYLGIIVPVIDALRSPIQIAAQVVRFESSPVITWQLTAPSLSFAAQRVIKPGEPDRGMVVVMHAKDQELLKARLSERTGKPLEPQVVWQQGGIQIVRIP